MYSHLQPWPWCVAPSAGGITSPRYTPLVWRVSGIEPEAPPELATLVSDGDTMSVVTVFVPKMFYNQVMNKFVTPNQVLGELGETAVKARFLSIGFQFDARSRLEAGIDGIAEVMIDGEPLARMIAVQIKSTDHGKYVGEDETGFSYTITERDLKYWKPANLPVIIVLYRKSDETFYWKEIGSDLTATNRKLRFNKTTDILNQDAVNRLADLTVPKAGFGYYVPPLGGGEEALVNILPLELPDEMFVSSTPYTSKKAMSILFENDGLRRFDWAIKGGEFWSFHDPRTSSCKHIVDLDQVEAIETEMLAFHEDIHEQNNFAFLLKKTLQRQTQNDLSWSKEKGLFYFHALAENTVRTYHYESSKHKAKADVVNVARNKEDKDRIEFVRHHAFIPRFELIADQWFLVVNPSYFFTTNGYHPHSHPHALLSGKKRLDNSASVRGQVIMWHRLLAGQSDDAMGFLTADNDIDCFLKFEEPPSLSLPMKVPEDVWGTPKTKVSTVDENQKVMEFL